MKARIIRNIFNGDYENMETKEEILVSDLKAMLSEQSNVQIMSISGEILDDGYTIRENEYVAAVFIPAGATAAIIAITAVVAVTTLVVSAVALSMAMKKIPGATKLQANPSLRGSTNTARKNQMLPILLGRHRIYPDVAALPFSSYSGNKQSLTQMFCFGYENISIDESSFKIGETLLSKYDNYQVSSDIQSLYPDRCIESSIGIALRDSSIERTTASGTWKIGIGLMAPSGIYAYNDDGERTSATIAYRIEYREHSSSAWINAREETLMLNQDSWFSMAEIIPPASGTYDVRVTRADKESESASVNDTFYFDVLQSWTESTNGNRAAVIDPGRFKLLALKIQATDQLNGIIDEFNAVCTLKARTYTGIGTGPESWAVSPTSNPASMLLYLLTDRNANPSPLSDEDIVWEEFEEFYAFCERKNLECNAYINSEDYSIREICDYIAMSNLAQIRKAGKRTGIIIDSESSMLSQLFTPMNASSFSMKKDFSENIRYFRIKYTDEDLGYVETERCISLSKAGDIIFDARIPEDETGTEISLFGCTSAEQAAYIGRQRILEISRQKRTFSWNTDIEGILCAPGDIVLFQHDQFSIGIGEGRIRQLRLSDDSLSVIGLYIDNRIPFQADKSYGMSIRSSDGITESIIIGNRSESDYIEILDPIPVGPEIGDLCVFGEYRKESIRLRIASIERDENNNCTVTAVDYDPSIYADGDIPPYDPGISKYPDAGNIGEGITKPDDWYPPAIPGKPGTVTIQYQYGESDRTPPTKVNLYRRGNFLLSFKGWFLADDDGRDWVDSSLNLTKDSTKPYLWMRISVDGGITWKYSLISGPPVSFYELKASKDTFRLNSRGAVDEEDTLSFWAVLHNLSDSEPISWTIYPSSLLEYEKNRNIDLTAKDISLKIPVGFNDEFIRTTLKVGENGAALSLSIYGELHGEKKPQKLPLVQGEDNLPEGTIDGIIPLIDGDYCLVEYETGERIPFRYSMDINPSTGKIYGWRKVSGVDSNYSEIMGNVLAEALEGTKTVESTSAFWGFFQNLAANDAFLRFLGTQYLHIIEHGAIYGGGYDRDGNIGGHQSGFHISADGTISSTKGRFQEAQVNGNFSCSDEYGNIMHTAKASVGKSLTFKERTRWRFNDFRDTVDLESDKTISYDGISYTATKFNHRLSVYTNMDSHDGKKEEKNIRIPYSGIYRFVYTVYGSRAELEIKRNGTSIISVERPNEQKEVHNKVSQIECTEGDEIYIRVETDGVPPVVGDPQRAMCDMSPDYPSIFIMNSNGIAIAKLIDSKEYYLEKRLTCEGFDSNNSAKLSNTDILFSLENKDYPYPLIVNNRISYNGSNAIASYILKSDDYAEIVFGDGTISRFIKADRSEFAEYGWYDISGTLTLQDTLRGLLVQSIFPNTDNGSTDGTNIGSADRPFGSVNAKYIRGTTIEGKNMIGNVNSESDRDKYKVWGAVAN